MLCVVSVDLDEIHHYHALHGLAAPEGRARAAVYDIALDRLDAFARAHHLPLTLFVVAADLKRAENAVRLRALAARGHEIGNHSLDHLYDLTRRPLGEIRRQVEEASDLLEAATGQRPRGFRAPGYTVTDDLLSVLADCGLSYDSSVFPCPTYYLGKAAALGAFRLRGRSSGAVLDHPRVLRAPMRPYRVGRPYWRRGNGILELPIQVTRRSRLPYIGTSLTLGGPRGARWLTRDVVGEPLVNLELHALDLLDESDGLEGLGAYQLDVRVPVDRKLEALSVAIEALRRADYDFVRLDEAAARVGVS
jgi:peptidoglycan/xylan/chitin deacetylase (PgdA/CDA1 family)